LGHTFDIVKDCSMSKVEVYGGNLKNLHLKCKRYKFLNNFYHWKFNNKSEFKVKLLGNKFTHWDQHHMPLNLSIKEGNLTFGLFYLSQWNFSNYGVLLHTWYHWKVFNEEGCTYSRVIL
jgi:hypothetical protein